MEGEAAGNAAKTSFGMVRTSHNGRLQKLTRGGVKYSKPLLLFLFLELRTSFMREYLSMRKLRLGPAGSRTIRIVGAFGVNEKAII